MAIIIPHRRSADAQQPAPPPPNEVYALMAATQMHTEGRLLAADQSTPSAKLDSIPATAQAAIR